MTVEATATGRSRGAEIAVASGIAVLIVLMLVAVMHHPVARHADPRQLVDSIARQAAAVQLVHGTVAAAMTVLTTLMLGFAARLGLARPHVLLGAVASCLVLVLICIAVLLDGFVAPALATRCVGVAGACAGEAQAMLRFGGLQIEFLTRFGLVALAGATALWAGDLVWRRDGAQIGGALGLVSAAVHAGLLIGGSARLNPDSLALIVAAQAVWYFSVAMIIVFRKGPYAAVPRG